MADNEGFQIYFRPADVNATEYGGEPTPKKCRTYVKRFNHCFPVFSLPDGEEDIIKFEKKECGRLVLEQGNFKRRSYVHLLLPILFNPGWRKLKFTTTIRPN